MQFDAFSHTHSLIWFLANTRSDKRLRTLTIWSDPSHTQYGRTLCILTVWSDPLHTHSLISSFVFSQSDQLLRIFTVWPDPLHTHGLVSSFAYSRSDLILCMYSVWSAHSHSHSLIWSFAYSQSDQLLRIHTVWLFYSHTKSLIIFHILLILTIWACPSYTQSLIRICFLAAILSPLWPNMFKRFKENKRPIRNYSLRQSGMPSSFSELTTVLWPVHSRCAYCYVSRKQRLACTANWYLQTREGNKEPCVQETAVWMGTFRLYLGNGCTHALLQWHNIYV